MSIKLRWLYFLLLITAAPATRSGKLDETTSTVPTPTDEKCKPCNPAPPPPPKPVPCPPPPALPPPSPPKKPPSNYCPPPPSFIYITGPPGNLYPVDNDFGSAAGRTAAVGLPVLIGCGLLGLLLSLGF